MMEDKTVHRGILDVLIEELETCTDYRDSMRVYYSMTEILFLTFCGMMCGCESYEDIVDYGKLKLDWLRKYLPYVNGVPSHDTVNRGLGMLNVKELSKVLEKVSSYEIPLLTGQTLQIDGKVLSGSATIKELQTKKVNGGKQALHTVNVFCSSLQTCLASVPIAEKGGEKQVVMDLLDVLDFKGSLLTLDANFCHKDLVKAIHEHGADYLIGLKSNQPKLLAAAVDLLSQTDEPCISIHTGEQEKGHGRIEKRDCFVISLEELPKAKKENHDAILSEWDNLKSFIKINSYRKIIATGKEEEETRYYIFSKKDNASNTNNTVRDHWCVENQLHWFLDTAFGEDRSRKRNSNAAFAFSVFRKIALAKLKNFSDPKVSIKRKMRKCAMSNTYLENILSIS